MISYHCNSNAILHEPFKTKSDKHCIPAYNAIRRRIAAMGHRVNLQILDSKASGEYKRTIEEVWKSTYQLVHPDMHHRNAAERTIRTFKAHFLAILAGVSPKFPSYMWDKLLEQAELTLNLMRHATVDPSKSAWGFFYGRP